MNFNQKLIFAALPLVSCSPESQLLNNGADADPDAYPAVVKVENPLGLCTGAFVSEAGDVLLAAHCTEDLEAAAAGQPRRFFTASDMKVLLPDGTALTGQTLLRHPEFAHAARPGADLAVVKVDNPMGFALPTPLRLAAQEPKWRDVVTIIGYGIPLDFDDVDNDGLRNDYDHCLTTPETSRLAIERFGDRAGCAPEETPQPLQLAGTSPRPAFEPPGKLRLGTNTIAGIDFSGTLRMDGPVTSVAPEGQVSSAKGDSGAPLLNAAGEVIGVCSYGDFKTIEPGKVVQESHYTSIHHERNKAFLAEAGLMP